MLCTYWDPIVFTFMEYIKIKSFMYSMNVNTMGSHVIIASCVSTDKISLKMAVQ